MTPSITGLLVAMSGCTDDRAEELRALVSAERAFSARAQEVNARQAFAEFFARDAIWFHPFPVPAFPALDEEVDWPMNIQWCPVAAAISGAGDMGYTTGPAEYRANADDEPSAFGHYTSVWGRQADGSYRVLVDLGVRHERPLEHAPEWTPPRDAPAASPTLAPEALRRAERELLERDRALGAGLLTDPFAALDEVLIDEGRVHREGALPMVGRDHVLATVDESDARFGWEEPSGVSIAASGDFGFTYGKGVDQGDGTGAPSDLVHLSVWQLRDGAWKLLIHVSQPVSSPRRD